VTPAGSDDKVLESLGIAEVPTKGDVQRTAEQCEGSAKKGNSRAWESVPW